MVVGLISYYLQHMVTDIIMYTLQRVYIADLLTHSVD